MSVNPVCVVICFHFTIFVVLGTTLAEELIGNMTL